MRLLQPSETERKTNKSPNFGRSFNFHTANCESSPRRRGGYAAGASLGRDGQKGSKARASSKSTLVAHHFLPTDQAERSDRRVHLFMPSKKDIFQRYLRKFTKEGKLLEAELGLASEQS